MKPKIRTILEDCIERGVHAALVNSDSIAISKAEESALAIDIEARIWLCLDEFFTFDD